jgi:hypothetical protein
MGLPWPPPAWHAGDAADKGGVGDTLLLGLLFAAWYGANIVFNMWVAPRANCARWPRPLTASRLQRRAPPLQPAAGRRPPLLPCCGRPPRRYNKQVLKAFPHPLTCTALQVGRAATRARPRLCYRCDAQPPARASRNRPSARAAAAPQFVAGSVIALLCWSTGIIKRPNIDGAMVSTEQPPVAAEPPPCRLRAAHPSSSCCTQQPPDSRTPMPPPRAAASPPPPSQVRSIMPLALVHTLGNLLTNVSLGAVAVSFTHTIKAMEPFFSVLLSALFLGDRPPPLVLLTLFPIIGGVAMASMAEVRRGRPGRAAGVRCGAGGGALGGALGGAAGLVLLAASRALGSCSCTAPPRRSEAAACPASCRRRLASCAARRVRPASACLPACLPYPAPPPPRAGLLQLDRLPVRHGLQRDLPVAQRAEQEADG